MEQTVTYNKAPLVELIVEVQWQVQTIGVPGGPPIVGGQSAAFDIWSQQLGSALRAHGYHNLERLVPHDMFLLAHQPLYRYSREGERFPIVQIGHGIFTVNAGPPSYQSWKAFLPQVTEALEALVSTRPAAVGPETFSRVGLRYIDRFGEELRGGVSNYAFIRDDLGISFGMPDGLLGLATDPNRISPTLALQLPCDDNATLVFQIAAGRLGNLSTTDTIMDMAYAVDAPIPVTVGDVLAALDKGYAVIHGWFQTLTLNIRERMQPCTDA